MPRYRAPRAAWFVTLLAIVLAGSWDAARAARPPQLSGLPKKSVALPRGNAGRMADTILARVGQNRVITRADFLEAWSKVQPPSRPDSLTPETAREFLDLLIGREALAEQALARPFTMTREESLKYRGLQDRLPLEAALDSALRAVQERMLAAGDTVTDRGALGVAARESLMARTPLVWNEPALTRMAAAFEALPRPSRDSSVMAQIRVMGALPVVTAAERETVLVVAAGEPFRVRELIEAWSRLNPTSRPRVSTAEQVQDLVKNGLFERRLRSEARRRKLIESPGIRRALEREYEYCAVEHHVAREVYARMDTTTARLRSWFAEREADFALPTRVEITRLTLPDRSQANAMAITLADEAETESLVVKAQRQGLRYRGEITEAVDAETFRRAARAGYGAVLGPDSTAAGWTVIRVGEVRPGRPRTFEEARRLAFQRYYGEEGERLMVELLERSRRATAVAVNPRGLAFIKDR